MFLKAFLLNLMVLMCIYMQIKTKKLFNQNILHLKSVILC